MEGDLRQLTKNLSKEVVVMKCLEGEKSGRETDEYRERILTLRVLTVESIALID